MNAARRYCALITLPILK